MGLSSSSDEWCRHSDRVVEGFPWCRKIVDGILFGLLHPPSLRSDLMPCYRDANVYMVTDYARLYKYVVRPVHPFPSVADIVQSIPASSTCFAKLDATHGYFQLPLDEEVSRLTTFLLPSGHYRYSRAPMGLFSSSDEWCRHSNRVVEGFPWCRKIVDDILIWASTATELEERLHAVLQRCERLHVTLSRSKFQSASSLNFAGCEGVQPDPARISSLSDFPIPRDQTGVRSFLGL